MKLFYKKISIHSSRSMAQVSRILSSVSDPALLLDKSFSGTVYEDSFKLTPFGGGRNSFRPWLYGKMTPTSCGTDISIEIKPLLRLPIVLFFYIAGVLFLSTSVIGLFKLDILQSILPPAVLISVFLFANLAFIIPAKKAIKLLNELLE